ncbi:hypothetical protein JKP88DRAFT_348857 [Tribonema minus]|uniref:RING-type domain-containing protein n=1 Tax=Tribonema minus TaxID=303371 RepID=A0A836CE73_9STRA|nr:hypothetical protein JKP88DRAFT_348857 [Tribonema minus]
MDLPAALNLSAERRERLLNRANREMHDANLSEPRYWWSGVATITAELLLYDLFLILLLVKLDMDPELPWFVVALPIWITITQAAIRDVVRYTLRREAARMTAHYLAFRIGHDVCINVAVLTSVLRLGGAIPASVPWVVVLVPLWVDAVACSTYLALAPVPPHLDDVAARDYRGNMWNAALFHLGAFGLQAGLIATKVDGILHGSWSNVFIPAFLALIVLVIALAGTTLHLMGVFCPMCLRLPSLSRPQRVIFASLALLALLAWMWLVCIFQAFEELVSALSEPKGPPPEAVDDILLPLITVVSVTVVFLPLLVATLVAAGVSEAGLAAGGAGGAGEAASLRPMAGPVMIVRQSSTYFKRATESLLDASAAAAEGDLEAHWGGEVAGDERPGAAAAAAPAAAAAAAEGEPKGASFADKLCYVCEGRPANAVLLECGHAGICYECGQGLVKQRRERSCPICRVTIEHIVRLPDHARCRIGQPVQSQEGMSVSVAPPPPTPGVPEAASIPPALAAALQNPPQAAAGAQQGAAGDAAAAAGGEAAAQDGGGDVVPPAQGGGAARGATAPT